MRISRAIPLFGRHIPQTASGAEMTLSVREIVPAAPYEVMQSHGYERSPPARLQGAECAYRGCVRNWCLGTLGVPKSPWKCAHSFFVSLVSEVSPRYVGSSGNQARW